MSPYRTKVLNRNFTIVGVYALVEGKEQDTEEFYRELQQSMDKIPKKENIILAGDFNRRIGNQPIPQCTVAYGEQVWSSIERFLCI
jgi:hypothetical protein